ncbi:MAG: alkaline phosphatase family protein [Bacilli bacterium]|nr:alkaline phosphatase family protein [Bacilli bacterium]
MAKKQLVSYKNSIANFTAALMKNYNIPTNYEPSALVEFLLSKKYKHVVLMVLDGMGRHIIDKNCSNGSILKTHQVMNLNSVFPPTTVAATTTFTTGLAPIESGWLGWHLYLNNVDPSITLFKNQINSTEEAFDKFKVEDIIPRDYWYNKLKRAKHYTIYPSWGENGVASLSEAFNQVKEICNKEESNFTYMYWDEPDTLMHEYGTTSQIVKVKLLEIEELVNKFAEEIPNETIVLITADHGLIDVEPLELINYPDFMECLTKPFAGEGRFAQFYVKEEKQEEFKELFNKYFNESFMLMSKEEFIKSQMAGLNAPNKIIEYALGDFVAVGTGSYYFTEQIKENDLVFKAHHAGLTPEEMETCVILLKRKDPKEEIEE